MEESVLTGRISFSHFLTFRYYQHKARYKNEVCTCCKLEIAYFFLISEGTLLVSCAAKLYKIPIGFRYVLPLESQDVMRLSVVYIKRLFQSRGFNFDTSSL